MGSCNTSDRTKCSVCRNIRVGLGNHLQCIDTCPEQLYKYQHQCISDIQCRNISTHYTTVDGNVLRNSLIPFNGTCRHTCPKHYLPAGADSERYCKSCNGECLRTCAGGTIDSVVAAQNYRGCGVIAGTLIIEINQDRRN